MVMTKKKKTPGRATPGRATPGPARRGISPLAVAGLVGIAGYFLLRPRKAGLSRPGPAWPGLARPGLAWPGLAGTLYTPAGSLAVPLTNIRFYPDSAVAANSAAVARIKANYGPYVSRSGTLTGIPEAVIYGFIFVESEGKPNARNGLSRGLMQLDGWKQGGPQAAVVELRKAGLLTDDIRAEMIRLLGAKTAAAILVMPNQTPTRAALLPEARTLDPEINIFLGCLMLRYLFYKHTDNGMVRLDRVVVNYNSGLNRKVLPLPTDRLIASLNSITAAYIPKLVGKNGIVTGLVA